MIILVREIIKMKLDKAIIIFTILYICICIIILYIHLFSVILAI